MNFDKLHQVHIDSGAVIFKPDGDVIIDPCKVAALDVVGAQDYTVKYLMSDCSDGMLLEKVYEAIDRLKEAADERRKREEIK